ncbi:DUF1853 family protein [Maribacter litoralis]|uniref:DUF1853 family protein n=1 Tax=Maribacter litoralis TaxID=2059726 RepID=UPI003F5CCDE0
MQFGVPQFQFPELVIDGFVPSPIPEKLRLGHRMEYVCKQLLDASAQYEVLLHNLPIREEKQTIGEIDFIVQETATQQLIHVELTYKFYIIDTEIKEPIHQLIGPNRRDAFYTKLEKIKNNQFSLLHTPVGRSVLLDKGIDTATIAQQVCYKAQLFQPYNSAPMPISLVNPNCFVGFWLRMTEFLTADFTQHHFYIPTKSEWVVDPENAVEWLTHEEVTTAITERLENNSAPMVWMKKNDTELEKFFVVWW